MIAGDEAGPSGLVAGAEPGAVVAVEVLVEQHEVLPVRDRSGTARCRRTPAGARRSSGRKIDASRRPSSSATSNSVHCVARAGRALDLEVVAVVRVQVQQAAQDEVVDGEPHRPPPVRVAAEHPGVGLGRQVVHLVGLAVDVEPERVLERGSATAPAARAGRGTRPRRACGRGPGAAWSRRARPASAARSRPARGRRGSSPAARASPRSGAAAGPAGPRSTVSPPSGSMRRGAQRAAGPTIERTLSRWALSVGQAQDVVEEAVLLVPQLVLVVADAVHRRGDERRSARRT